MHQAKVREHWYLVGLSVVAVLRFDRPEEDVAGLNVEMERVGELVHSEGSVSEADAQHDHIPHRQAPLLALLVHTPQQVNKGAIAQFQHEPVHPRKMKAGKN